MNNLDAWFLAIPGLQGQLNSCLELAYGDDATHLDVCPPPDLVFRALEMVPPLGVRAVILGQDPYHHPGKASGLCFGYNKGWHGAPNSSLKHILQELGPEGRFCNYSLEHWAERGVLLLNTRLTVLAHKPMSHASGRNRPAAPGWEVPVRAILGHLAPKREIVWLLWGGQAQKAAARAGLSMFGPNVISTTHPCKYSNTRGPNAFTGSDCFNRANRYLQDTGQEAIKWV